MCGIAGIVGKPVEKAPIKAMLKTMHRRGPDGNGVYQSDMCTLLHTRLAIIDPIGGAQPMSAEWGGNSYVICYNGEIYNLPELRKDLTNIGHTFVTHSDTEVVLHAFIEWKEGCLGRLNGIFAFAVWSQQDKRLFLARDRMGVKPLFYHVKDETIIFASEVKTILADPDVERKMGQQGVSQLILLGPGRIPGKTLFENIYDLIPGYYAWFENGKLRTCQYWCLKDFENTDSFNETAEKVRWLVNDSIKRQMISDVPIGTFLSGGLDSSIISAVCAQEQKHQLDTFSVGYENNFKYFSAGKFQPDQDDSYIDIMKAFIGSVHHQTMLRPEELVSVMEESTIARDAPGMADVDFSLFSFCRQVKKHVKVALSGECADEMFGGYPWFRDPEIRNSEGFPWSQNLHYRAGFIRDDWKIDLEMPHDLYRDTVNHCDILPGTNPVDKRTKELVVLNIYWFMQTLLERKDRMSMYHGLEVRVPFCDHRLAEYLYTVPWKNKDYMGREKGLLRQAMHGLLPDKILWRKKSPYPKTHDPEYCALVETRLRELLEDKASPLFQLVYRDRVLDLLQNEHPWPWYGQLMTRPQTIAYFLQVDYWLRNYKVMLV